MSNVYPIELEAFATWLLSQPMTATVGIACSDWRCPLAQFLGVQFPGSSFFVHLSYYERNMDDVDMGCESLPGPLLLPQWASLFVSSLDMGVSEDERSVMCEEALTCLRLACSRLGLPFPEVQHA